MMGAYLVSPLAKLTGPLPPHFTHICDGLVDLNQRTFPVTGRIISISVFVAVTQDRGSGAKVARDSMYLVGVVVCQ